MAGLLFVAAEGLPFVKTGGLADVIGSLPKALTHEGFNVSVIMPLYLKTAKKDRDSFKKLTTLTINVGVFHQIKTAIYSTDVKGITYYFVEHAGYFEREGYYGYPDDGERFAFFNHAVMHLLESNLIDIQVVHCHDWHTGLVPLLAKTLYAHRIKPVLSLFTIHNLAFQGNFPYGMLESCIGLSSHYYFDGSLRFKAGISFMKAGILYADLVTTVSDTYAKEILTPEFGEHMEDVLRLRQKDLYGIVNGIDVEDWDPSTDPHLAANYTLKNIAKGKLANKLAIQRELGLRQDPNVMLVAMVSRLTDQKGIWLLLQSLGTIMGWDLQLIILGTGDSHVEGQLKPIEFRYPHRAVFYCGYNEALAHRIYAGSDVFLMPSLFEPCGISQQIAMRYGTLPLARETGGLKDTVEPYNQHTLKGTGFTFGPFSVEDFKHVLWLAYDTYTFRQDHFKAMIKHAMKKDLSWDRSAKLYAKLIRKQLPSK
jgi:starch synthase